MKILFDVICLAKDLPKRGFKQAWRSWRWVLTFQPRDIRLRDQVAGIIFCCLKRIMVRAEAINLSPEPRRIVADDSLGWVPLHHQPLVSLNSWINLRLLRPGRITGKEISPARRTKRADTPASPCLRQVLIPCWQQYMLDRAARSMQDTRSQPSFDCSKQGTRPFRKQWRQKLRSLSTLLITAGITLHLESRLGPRPGSSIKFHHLLLCATVVSLAQKQMERWKDFSFRSFSCKR